ncbi:hypothetical protein GCM10010182_61940 [Actinomadura cremea]|nr:hypothetical protein GCM10010182_61940 [Actinomadura cremea]
MSRVRAYRAPGDDPTGDGSATGFLSLGGWAGVSAGYRAAADRRFVPPAPPITAFHYKLVEC